MSRATTDDQLKFLLSCVRHSNNGKIDFVEVARECGVVSKGAAAKRYERLLKANGIHPNGGSAAERSCANGSAAGTSPMKSTPKSRAEIAKAAAVKRRKIEGDDFFSDFKRDDEFNIMDGIDVYHPFKNEQSNHWTMIKSEPNSGLHPMPCHDYPHTPSFLQKMPASASLFSRAAPIIHNSFPYGKTLQQRPRHDGNLLTQQMLGPLPASMLQSNSQYPQPPPKFPLNQHANTSTFRDSPVSCQHVDLSSISTSAPTPTTSSSSAHTVEIPAPEMNPDHKPPPLSLSSASILNPVIPEDQIQTTFDEFCKHDLFLPNQGRVVDNELLDGTHDRICKPEQHQSQYTHSGISASYQHMPVIKREAGIKIEPDFDLVKDDVPNDVLGDVIKEEDKIKDENEDGDGTKEEGTVVTLSTRTPPMSEVTVKNCKNEYDGESGGVGPVPISGLKHGPQPKEMAIEAGYRGNGNRIDDFILIMD